LWPLVVASHLNGHSEHARRKLEYTRKKIETASTAGREARVAAAGHGGSGRQSGGCRPGKLGRRPPAARERKRGASERDATGAHVEPLSVGKAGASDRQTRTDGRGSPNAAALPPSSLSLLSARLAFRPAIGRAKSRPRTPGLCLPACSLALLLLSLPCRPAERAASGLRCGARPLFPCALRLRGRRLGERTPLSLSLS
jgi:hypothetical protein